MKKWLKYTIGFLAVLITRLIPFRAPNLEPVMAVIMPFGKVYGGLMAFIFGVMSIVVFDSFTSGLGIWTVVTGLAYGLIGLGSYFYFKNHSGRKSYALYAFVATIVYDCLTGLTIGPLFFHQSFLASVIGQIPFTVIHLLGNVSFAMIISPIVEGWIVKEKVTSNVVLKEEIVRV